jgi:hypothetical protein
MWIMFTFLARPFVRFDSARLLRLTDFLQLDREGRGKNPASVMVDRAHGLGGGAEDRPIKEITSGSNPVPVCFKY